MNVVIRILCTIVIIFSTVFSFLSPVDVYSEIEEKFSDNSKAAYSELFYELSESGNNTESWRQGMISGNGIQGVITSGSPYNDSLIYQNMHFNTPNENDRTAPVSSQDLEGVKQSIVAGEDISDPFPYTALYEFHPGGAVRIKQKKSLNIGYARYTDYETAQVGVRYTDFNGTWERTTFTSKADDVTITEIGSSSLGTKVNLTLSIDNISAFANYGNAQEVDFRYKKLAGDNGEYLAFVAHYPDYEKSELKNGGYSTVIYIVCDGGNKEVVNGGSVRDDQYCASVNPQVKITDANSVYLIAASDRTFDMGKYSDFESATSYALVDSLVAKTKAVADKYADGAGFDYDAALAAHTAIFTPEYNAVTLDLGEASTEPNEKLVLSQHLKSKINSQLAQRTYYSGRYSYLCASGVSVPRLYGMWTGEWQPGWGAKYTMDANVNLQTSSMNTSNMESTYIGYASFILRQVDDWEENAFATHGFTEAIQAPGHSDGDNAAVLETCYSYPFRYWNAGASWMLLPLYETLQCYGDVEIPINGEYDLNELRSVLSVADEDLTDEEIAALEAQGYLDLRSQILLPLLTKAANYWDQMVSPEYYTDAEGKMHYQQGKTALNDGETYTLLPGYSPENNPENYPSPSTANTAIDIAACKSNLEMLINVMKSVDPEADTSHWEYLMSKLPVYLYDETGALKEWATVDFTENNLHRHLSHLYCAWPVFETQENAELAAACIKAIDNRASENEASHALIHRALISARLKDRASVTDALTKLMNHWIYYDSLMTNHDYDRSSCYCTDYGIGYLGIVNESLLYSNTGKIEILPAIPATGFEAGSIEGLRARTNAVVDEIEWDLNEGTASVTFTSDIDQTVTVSCGLSDESETITIRAGESYTRQFKLK
ncbi:MAG: glycoside hydrolase N-terminal domain-containing protein [Clostridia bacterium]|nr:glycoside hydrolase N-terminal domain-containing protein [Clostridia bacterium]